MTRNSFIGLRKIATPLLIVLGLGGCARDTVESLRTDPGVAYEFHTDKKLEDVYQTTINGFTRCLTGSSNSSAPLTKWTMAIQPRIAVDHRSASISYLQHALHEGFWATVDFVVVDRGTKINVSTIDNPGIKRLGSEVEKWIGGSQECGVGNWFSDHHPEVE